MGAIGPRRGREPAAAARATRRIAAPRRDGRRRKRSRLVDIFEAEAHRCASTADLRRLLEDVTRELGFRYFALLHHASLRSNSAPLVRIDNYPSGWEHELVSRDLVADDPVHHASVRTNIGFAWTSLGALLPLNPRQHRILRESGRFGIGEGFTVPANVPGEPSGSCSFATRRGRRLPAKRLLCAELIGAHAFEAARRIHDYPSQSPPAHLSPRQLECLRLIAAGKTDWEIAQILDLSIETAHQYVKSARAAYDVVSRTQLVVHGLRDAWISFDDAIPPSG
jgi:LuxR family transcriptional regulator, quorum-sensing system regulator CciR